MSNFPSYPTRSFSETQKFFVLDPQTGTPSFVLGSDLVNQLTPNSNYVFAESTRATAQATDYQVGQLIQTAGSATAGDGLASGYLVVPSGDGDFPMDNGNELLVISGDDALREQLISNASGEGSDLVAHTGTANTVTETLDQNIADINQRVIYVGSVAELESIAPISGQQARLSSGGRSGHFLFVSSDRSSEVSSDPLQGVYIAPGSDPTGASGAWVRQYGQSVSIKPLVRPEWYGAVGDGVADDTPAVQAAHDTNGVELSRATYRCASSVSIPDGKGFILRGLGDDSTIYMEDGAVYGWDGTDKTEALRHFTISDVRFKSPVRSIDGRIVSFIADGSVNGVPSGGKDFYRFTFRNVKIDGTTPTSNNAIGLDLRGGYIGTFDNIIIQYVDLGLRIDQAPRTSYGGQAYFFNGGEIQGVNKLGNVTDAIGVHFNMTLEGSQTAGMEFFAPNKGIEIGGYFEGNAAYDLKFTKVAGERNTNIDVKSSTTFADGTKDKDHAILVESAVQSTFGGRFIGYAAEPISNIGDFAEVIGYAENVTDGFEDWSNAGTPAIDKETSLFYWKERSIEQDVSTASATATETVIASYTIPAGGLNERTHPVRFKVSGQLAANANAKSLRVTVSSNNTGVTFDTTKSGGYWVLDFDIIPTAINAQKFVGRLSGAEAANEVTGGSLSIDTRVFQLLVEVRAKEMSKDCLEVRKH